MLSGVIDLVFKDKCGWVVVDYKTDRCESGQDVEQLAQMYRGQLYAYCRVWELLTQEKVSDGELYFTSFREAKKVV